jgi:hypothetical protein
MLASVPLPRISAGRVLTVKSADSDAAVPQGVSAHMDWIDMRVIKLTRGWLQPHQRNMKPDLFLNFGE